MRPRWQVRRCRAHRLTYPCWLLRRYQEGTDSYVHSADFPTWDEAMKAAQP